MTPIARKLMHRRPKTKKQVLAIIAMHVTGKSLAQIAAETELSKSSIRRVVRDVMDCQYNQQAH